MSEARFDQRGGDAAIDDQQVQRTAPGKETLAQQVASGQVPSDHEGAAGGAPAVRAPTYIAMSGGGMSDPFDFSGFSGGLGSAGEDQTLGGSTDETLGGNATRAGTTVTSAATWSPHGRFKWWIGWTTDGTGGWIVQKVTNTYSGTKGDGSTINNSTTGTVPQYYEAWAVDSTGAISPSAGSTHDMWERISLGTGSRGSWSMRGEVYWTATDPAGTLRVGGITPNNAGILLSGTSAPAGLGNCLLNRSASGTWNSTSGTPTHSGTAA